MVPLPLIALLFGVFCSTAYGQDPADSGDAHYERGMKHYQAGRFLEAAREYLLAYELEGAPELSYNAARAFDRAGRWDDAEVYYRKWLRAGPRVAERENLAEKIQAAGNHALTSGDPPGALSRLRLADDLRFSPDAELTASLAWATAGVGNRAEAKRLFERALQEGHPRPAEVRRALSGMSGFGFLILQGQLQDSAVLLNDKPLDMATTGEPIQVPEGEHRLEVRKEGFHPFQARVQIRSGQRSPVPVRLQALPSAPTKAATRQPISPPTRHESSASGLQWSGLNWPPPAGATWSLSGGIVAIGAGLVFGSLAKGAETQLDDCRNKLSCAVSDVALQLSERADRRQLQANIAFSAAAIAATAAIVLWWQNRDRQFMDLDELDKELDHPELRITW